MTNYSQITAHSARRTNRGFSLVELMFAVVLLSIIVFGVVKLQTSNLSLSNTQKNASEAHFYANQGVEIVKGLGYSDFCSGTYPCDRHIKLDGATYSLDTSDANDPIDPPFWRIVRIEEDVALTNAYKVTSIIGWTDSTGAHDETGGAVTASLIIF